MASWVKTSPLHRNSWSALNACEGFIQRARRGGNLCQLFRGQVVDIFVQRITRIDFILDAVDDRHQDGGKGQITVAGWIRCPELDAFGLG